ncbi:hypothetical protein ACH437_23815 [Streptomyces xinghaiensis]|uniref:hypothetical protein n=1 Tax=Streptomyces xinghaiensis TaxID=1038928 RepID=UPI00379670B8
MDESFGPEYLRPAQADCPRCGCCTAALCEKGRTSFLGCRGHVDEGHRETVTGCPCSAETTRETAAWRMAQVRVTRLAAELPLTAEAELLLRGLATGRVGTGADGGELLPQLRVRGLVQLVHGMPAITQLGYTYLAARDDVREVTAVRVVDVDRKRRTARVAVPAWRPDELVTVLLDQVLCDSGLDLGSLPGRELAASANCAARSADRLVLTGFRDARTAPAPAVEAGAGHGGGA